MHQNKIALHFAPEPDRFFRVIQAGLFSKGLHRHPPNTQNRQLLRTVCCATQEANFDSIRKVQPEAAGVLYYNLLQRNIYV